MSGTFATLLEATIQHLEEWREAGNRYVSVDLRRVAELKRAGNAIPRGTNQRVTSRANTPVGATASQPEHDGENEKNGPAQTAVQEFGTGPNGAAPTDSSASKEEAMAGLRERALACVKCPHLVRTRRNVVFGVGNIHSRLMFVGEAPGMDEDKAGEPFVGRAGQLLTKIIQAMGLSRETVYIANVLKCRPDTPNKQSGNRRPTPEEMRTCLPYLQAQIDLIGPQVLVALGGTAMEGLLGTSAGITKLRGRWTEFCGIPVMPTYHPSYVLRQENRFVKREIWEDILAVMERLEMPISDKQRNYFLAAREQ